MTADPAGSRPRDQSPDQPAPRGSPSSQAEGKGIDLPSFQALMDELYGPADRERGIPSTVAWLCEEMGELAQAVRKGTREEQLHELGDVLAWLASLAGQLDLSLDDAARRYLTHPPN